jgi:hypothetical protein
MSKRRNPDSGFAPFRHPDHPRPVTRRQFLAQGFLTGSAFVIGPSLAGFFRSSQARADVLACDIGFSPTGRIPFVVFDLAGGASTAGSNVLVGKQGGQLDPLTQDGYGLLGIPPAMTPVSNPANADPELGLVFHADSAILRGIRQRSTAATRAKVNGAIFCAKSDNDTGNNPHNPMYGIYKAGADGQLVTLIGTKASDSGGNSQAPMSMIDPTVRPTKVDRPSDATGLVDTGKLVQLLPNSADAEAVMLAAQNLSDQKVALMNETQLVSELIQCAFRETTDLVANFGDPNALNPLADPLITGDVTSIFTAADLNTADFRKTASVMKLVVNGFAGAGTIELGGYDYHDGTRASGERRDFNAGQAIGAVLEYASRLNTPVAIYVLSDGSLSANGQIDNSQDGRGKFGWAGDNSSTAGTFMLVFDPDGRPPLGPAGNQVGWFRATGNVETAATRISDEVNLLAQAIVLNYLALHNQVGTLGSVLPSHGLGSGSQLDPLIAFANLPRFT